MSSRTRFTHEEDSHLVKYIAKYNPSSQGRSGNRLYQILCEDADNKWKWSRTHTWQSWRDHYYKNRREFDIKIKKYQMKHRNLAAGENMDKASSEERMIGISKRKRGNEKEEKCIRVKHDSTNVQVTGMGHDLNRIQKQSQISASATEDTNVLDKRKVKAVVNHNDGSAHTQEESAAFSVTPIVVVNQKVANADESSLPRRTTLTSSPSFYANAKGQLSQNPHEVDQMTSVTERQQNPSTMNKASYRAVPADTQSVASSSKVQISPESNVPSKGQAIQNHRRRKPVAKDDIFFDSSPPSSSPLNSNKTIRPRSRNPKLVEGPFGTRFAVRRRSGGSGDDSSENEKEALVRPPPWKRDNFKGKGKAVECMINNTVTSTLPRNVENAALPAARQKIHSAGKYRPENVSLSPMNGFDNGQEEANNLSASLQTQQSRFKHPVHRGGSHKMKETPGQHSVLQIHSSPHDTSDSVPVVEPRTVENQPEPLMLPLPRHSWTSLNPFRSPDEGIIRRHSMGNLCEVRSSAVRRLDLRAEMAKRRLAASSPFTFSRGHSVVTTVSYQPSPKSSYSPFIDTGNNRQRRSSIPIADEDREQIEFLGLIAAIEGIARDSGYPMEQVWRVYDHYRSIKRTEEWIRLYRKNSARLQELTHEQMMQNGMGSLPIADEHHTPRSSPLERNQLSEPSTEPTDGTRPSSPKAQDNRLKIKRLTPDLQCSLSDYSPPQETRAGEYNRLVGQGRMEEAMLREHRRASGSGGVFPILRSSPAGALVKSPPTNGAESLERNGDGIEDEDDVVFQLLDESNDSEVVDCRTLQEEEEMLFLSARMEMVDQLRAIEQRIDPNYMLQWVAARLGEVEHEFRLQISSS